MRRFKLPNLTAQHQKMLDDWQPIYDDGCIVNDCPPLDDWSGQVQDVLEASAISFDPTTAFTLDQMPVVKYVDSEFQEWLNRQVEICDGHRANRVQCLFPWEVLNALPQERKKSDDLYFPQGGLPSCAMHSAAFAHHGSTLSSIALGSPLVYDPINPIYTFWLAKGKSYRGGMNLAPLATAINTLGHYPLRLVGKDNQRADEKLAINHADVAARSMSGIVLLPTDSPAALADAIIRCCRAGLGVSIGNGLAVRGVEIDVNGMKIVVLGGSWAHATGFIVYWVVNGVEYIYWVNSHGPRYKTSKLCEPAHGAWMIRKQLEEFCKTAKPYGTPFAVLPKSDLVAGVSLGNIIRVPYQNYIVA